MEDGNQVVFNIYGGSRQINPTAATAIRNYYGGRFAADKLREESLNLSGFPPEAQALAVHVSHAGNLTLLRRPARAMRVGKRIGKEAPQTNISETADSLM
ncbi:hypothetical protein Bacsa_2745 [Phocaeicola salanitronis DSM 18170]|uniref:Uncharacterized protein n=1 Tax=Phocaeicola salanitronis (strain DSM 18170 / JCM 13657 / CCUG 60908 / BL78) TaxID=667015 RepID=F0R0D4_PHOSB|nr:hypothetical protein Bacsa_2745 [Phocaeicola salanitronis DSM 18170]